MPDTIVIEFDKLTTPANRDRVAEIERLLRQILYSEEMGIEPPPGLILWAMGPDNKISMQRDIKIPMLKEYAESQAARNLGRIFVGVPPLKKASESKPESAPEPDPPKAA